MPEITVNFMSKQQQSRSTTAAANQQKIPQLANDVNRLFSIYQSYIGDRQPMVGGAQGLLMKFDHSLKIGAHLDSSLKKKSGGHGLHFATFSVDPNKSYKNKLVEEQPSTSFFDLPIDVVLYIFAFLDVNDLCRACLVNEYFYSLANDEYLWRQLLDQDSNRWRQIHFDKNPDIYRQVCPGLSSKQIYLKCRERFTANYANLLSGKDSNPISSLFFMIMPTGKPRVLMFGPGLETKTSKIVRSILTDRCMNESTRFKVTGLVPGGFSGVGSGISIRFEDREFNLVVLYSNVKSVRQRLSAENRVRENKLFIKHESSSNNHETDSNDLRRQYFEVTPAVQELCKSSHAFIYVVDATQTAREIAFAQTELFAMSCELWSPNAAPLLILACRRNCAPKEALSSMAVVRTLRLGRLNKKWMTQSAEVESLDGVRSGVRWLMGQL